LRANFDMALTQQSCNHPTWSACETIRTTNDTRLE
jgi:hypothetical protein